MSSLSLTLKFGFPALCFGLGSWQLYRLRWKEKMLSEINLCMSQPALNVETAYVG